MNGVVAGPAHPEGAGDQVFFDKQLLEPFIAMQMFGDEVVTGEFSHRSLTELTAVWLEWKSKHGGWT